MIEIFPITLTQAEFRSAPEAERSFYLKLGMITNEVNVLNKVSLFSLTQLDNRDLMNRAGSVMGLLFRRLLAGRLHEAHKIITTGYKPLKQAYEAEMSEEGRQSYSALVTYFADKNNFIKSIRNKLAFHTDPDVFRRAVEAMDADETIVDYMCHSRGNTLFWSGETALISALSQLAQTRNAAAMYGRLLDDTTEVAGLIADFSYSFGLAFFKRNFPGKMGSLGVDRIEITDAPVLTDFSLPWFCEPPTESQA